MPVSGLVVTLAEEPRLRGAAETSLRSRAFVTFGEPFGRRLPIVIDTGSAEAHAEAIDEVQALDGVLFVEVVFTDFSDVESVQRAPRRRRRVRSFEV